MTIISQIEQILGVDAATSSEVTIQVNGHLITGWTEVAVVMGLEIMPWTAELGLTTEDPQTALINLINPGDICEVLIGTQKVITGYVITVAELAGPGDHMLRIAVASKSTDLVECSALLSSYQMSSTNALAIARAVCERSQITVSSINGAGNANIQLFSVILSETGYQVIERVCRLAGVLFYDQPDGNIVFSGVGTQRAASGFVVGGNVEQVSQMRSLAARYSQVIPVLQTADVLQTAPSNDRLADQMASLTVGPPAIDPHVPRDRPMLILIEAGDADHKIAERRAQWEINRRYGRSQAITLTCDSWRDSAGSLWQPNTVAPFTDYDGNSRDLVIGEVTLRAGQDGTHADLVLMPSEAFQPEPMLAPMANNEGVQAVVNGND
ncbi:phage tail protein [Asaia siamensis]|uniref:Tail protein n=1 Tax=Asaia siamensis TaxID=110479 RepID=A0ABQ1M5S4_9PROT|nr:phage tail protein [Asaia siamensis]GBR06430.1 bacteriophage tail protein [Asaia siamensis NRIC 0323]GGC34131.1 tail protein [Asaia siamensis]